MESDWVSPTDAVSTNDTTIGRAKVPDNLWFSSGFYPVHEVDWSGDVPFVFWWCDAQHDTRCQIPVSLLPLKIWCRFRWRHRTLSRTVVRSDWKVQKPGLWMLATKEEYDGFQSFCLSVCPHVCVYLSPFLEYHLVYSDVTWYDVFLSILSLLRVSQNQSLAVFLRKRL